MKKLREIQNIAVKTLKNEAEAIAGLVNSIDSDFVECVRLIYRSKGRVVVTGIGKSAIIGQKIVATLNSTGTPAVFMHAADAIHGDLGTIRKEDITLCLSKSGETPEIRVLIPLIRQLGGTLIALVGNRDSYLAQQADYILDAAVSKEACPNNLAPTSSTTAQLAMGDALAVCLLECRGFTTGDFAKLHPGGTLGKKLYLKVADLYPANPKPMVGPNDSIQKVILEISSNRLGATAVIDNNRLAGIITDGDLRRMLEKDPDLRKTRASGIMTRNPKTIGPETLAIDALGLMRKNNITQLIVLEKEAYLGMVHLHDILKEGIL